MNTLINSPPAAFNVMVDHLADAARDVFADFGVAIQPRSESAEECQEYADEETTGMAVIGYAGAGVRGALVMVVPESAIRTWMVAAGIPDGDPCDTLGEFSNMVFGRLKERLLPAGIALTATTPTAATGAGLRLSDAPCPTSWASFDGPDFNLRVRLDASFDADFQPTAAPLAWEPKTDAIDFDAFEMREA